MNKFCKSLSVHGMGTINFKKEKNEVMNKQAAKNISEYKNLLHL